MRACPRRRTAATAPGPERAETLLQDGVKYTAVVCGPLGETRRVTLTNKLGNKELIELDFR